MPKITKAVILVGGLGTRMRHLTDDQIPKALVMLKGKTLTEHNIENLKRMGINEIVLSIGHHAEKVKAYFGDGSRFGVKISYVVENEPLGTGGWMNLIDKKEFKSTFMVLNGDDILKLGKEGMAGFQGLHKENNALVSIALSETGDVSIKGVAELRDDKILRFVEKPKPEEAPSNLISTGNYLFEPEVLSLMQDRVKISLERDVFPLIASKEKLCGFNPKAEWHSIGNKEEYEIAEKRKEL
ncbi:hypothetical protein COV19_05565 [Candidatus Woesearchaeota archaeon CG10_big_fil_rev_8_21_14_0_10_44_13]|nr:MAG: hypothetical protein COV19_05565 [Candidatus Woesearchaeota archaeon CG10_big_fil_rev_8_21_14_0_10_44_13]